MLGQMSVSQKFEVKKSEVQMSVGQMLFDQNTWHPQSFRKNLKFEKNFGKKFNQRKLIILWSVDLD
jgi:hypothetical protein